MNVGKGMCRRIRAHWQEIMESGLALSAAMIWIGPGRADA